MESFLTPKPATPSQEEGNENSRQRSYQSIGHSHSSGEVWEEEFESLSKAIEMVRHFRHGLHQTEHLLFIYLQSFVNICVLVVVEFLENWPRVVTDPFGSFLTFVIIPVGNMLLLVACSLWIIARFLVHYILRRVDHSSCLSHLELSGATNENHECGTECEGQVSVVNWAAAKMFEVTNISKGLDLLGTESSTEHFDFDIAQCLLVLSAFVYESDLGRPQCFTNCAKKRFGLDVRMVELDDAPRRSAFLFYSIERNVIVLCFKGTSPFNIHEIYVDASVQKVDARGYVFGGVHHGFYTSLFSRKQRSSQQTKYASSFEQELPSQCDLEEDMPLDEQSPYHRICEQINHIVKLLHKHDSLTVQNAQAESRKQRPRRKPKFWVTGHSLGAAIATLFYARMLKSEDVTGRVELVGAYTFGSPRVGNFDFAQEFESFTNADLKRRRRRKLWRVVNGLDLIPRLPIGQDTIRFTRLGSGNGQSSLDYFHVGSNVHLHWGSQPEVHSHADRGFGVSAQIGHLALLAQDYIHSWTHWTRFLTAAYKSYRQVVKQRTASTSSLRPTDTNTSDAMSDSSSGKGLKRKITLKDLAKQAVQISKKCVSHVEAKPDLARKAFKAAVPALLFDHTPGAYLSALSSARDLASSSNSKSGCKGWKSSLRMFIVYLLDDETTQKLQEKVRMARQDRMDKSDFS
jgi:hypothetical protein